MLEPDGRRVRLTEAAQLLLSHAHQIFTHLEHAESDLAAFRRGDAGTVRLGTFSSAVKALAVPVISDLATRTRLRVEIREVEPEDAIDALLSRTVDVSLTLASTDLLPGQDDQRLHIRAPARRRRGCRAALRSSAGRSGRDRTGRPGGRRLDPGPPGRALLAPGPGGLRTRRLRAASRHYADEFIGVVGLVAAGMGSACCPGSPSRISPTSRSSCGRSPGSARSAGSARRSGRAPPIQPHIAPVLESLRRIAAAVAVGSDRLAGTAAVVGRVPADLASL